MEMVYDNPKAVPEKTAFGILSSVGPIVNYNPEMVEKSLKKAGFEFNQDSFVRLEKAKNWIETYNPNKNFKLLPEFNQAYFDTLSDFDREVISKLVDYVEHNEFTEKEIQQFLYNIINDDSASKKENLERQKVQFKNLYNMLFGLDAGPRLYLYLSAVDKTKYVHLLKK